MFLRQRVSLPKRTTRPHALSPCPHPFRLGDEAPAAAENNFVILEGFLSVLLNDDIRIEQMLESESNQETPDDKFNRVDILAQNAAGQLIIVEVQNSRQLDYFQRMLYGVSKATAEYLDLGEPYREIKKVYSVNIVHFDLG